MLAHLHPIYLASVLGAASRARLTPEACAALLAYLDGWRTTQVEALAVYFRTRQTEATVIELTYPELVSMHSQYRLVPFDGLLIPLEERHSEWHVIFFSQHGQTIAGALRLATTDPMKDALADLGYW